MMIAAELLKDDVECLQMNLAVTFAPSPEAYFTQMKTHIHTALVRGAYAKFLKIQLVGSIQHKSHYLEIS